MFIWRRSQKYNNPCYLFIGYVKAGLYNGLPSQPNKNNGLEHPMWLIAGHNYLSNIRIQKEK